MKTTTVSQLQHDAGLILSNVQVLQQLVTALNRTSSEVMRVVYLRLRRSGDLCRWRRAMPACRAATASRTCHSEPGGEVELYSRLLTVLL